MTNALKMKKKTSIIHFLGIFILFPQPILSYASTAMLQYGISAVKIKSTVIP